MAEREFSHRTHDDAGDDLSEQLTVRVAWCYYRLGLTQQEVAARLGITRVRVNRQLAEARRRGIVRITVTSKLAENIELEERLKSVFGLDDAHVVLGLADDAANAEILGDVAAEILGPQLVDGSTIGVGWGMTLRALASAMPERPLPRAAVVAMLGSLTRRSSIDAFEAATALAHRLHAECFYMPGPLICDSAKVRKAIESQPLVVDIKERAQGADVALFSVGGLDSGTIRQAGLIDAEQLNSVRSAGAIGNFLGHYVDCHATIVDHPINDRVLGTRPDEIVTINKRVMVSGGATKVPVLRALLQHGLITELVTDQASAQAILNPVDQGTEQ
ncbi:MAG: sugar-binding domain-containing protein [Pseudomonadota bacterium]